MSISAIVWCFLKSVAEAGAKHEAEAAVSWLHDHMQLHPDDWHTKTFPSLVAPQDQAAAKALDHDNPVTPAPVREG